MLTTLTLLSLTMGGSDDKLKTVVDAHAASVAAVRTLTCNYTFSHNIPGALPARGEYRRSGTDFHLKVTYADGRTNTTSSVGGTAKGLYVRGRGPDPLEGLIEADNGDLATDLDPYFYNLFRFYGPTKFRCELSEILGQKCKARYAGRVERGGRKLERVEVTHDRAELTIDFDPEVNYLARVVSSKSRLASESGKPLMEQEVTEFREVAPGVFYPVKARCVNTATGKQTWSIEFSDIKANQPVAPATLALKFPPKVQVMDKVRGGVFVTDGAGEPTLPALKNGRPLKMATGEDPVVNPPEPDAPTRPTQEEPKSLSRWVLPASLGLLGTGVVLGFIRRRGRAE